MSARTFAFVAIIASLVLPSAAQAEKWRDPVYKDMFNMPSFKYGEAPRNLPKDSVPVQGRSVEISRYDPAIDTVANPVSGQTDLSHGKFLFETYCYSCHGIKGGGDGPLLSKGLPGPSLVSDFYKQKSDGFIWATILQGGAIMPPYYDSMSRKEAWEVVNYIRSLQNQ